MIKRAVALISLAVPATAGDLSLSIPIDCDLETDCYIQQYVDHDPSEQALDFTCGPLSYDTHKGTDFALSDLARMAEGVDVLAAAPGIVKSLRDGMPDTGYSPQTSDQIKGRECGNGVVLQHADGWETQYCHLRSGSLQVRQGDAVEANQPLGQVGMSGRAQFPHLHLSLRQNGSVVDPFDPTGVISCQNPEPNGLWITPPPVRPGGIISLGITGQIPEFSAIKAGTTRAPTPSDSALVVYGYLFGTRAGDLVELTLRGPQGQIVDQQIRLKKQQALSFRAAGKKRRTDSWPTGSYTATVSFIRDGKPLETRNLSLQLN